jgi:hypothetical protein
VIIEAYLILSFRAGFVFAVQGALAAFIYSGMWLLERFIHLFSSSEPMLWDYVPRRCVFDGGEALMVGAVAIHGLKDVWTVLECGKAPQCVSPNRDVVRTVRSGDGSD